MATKTKKKKKAPKGDIIHPGCSLMLELGDGRKFLAEYHDPVGDTAVRITVTRIRRK